MTSSVPKVGENVKVVLLNGDTIEGIVEWIDGNGALVKGGQKTRWVPLESLLSPPPSLEAKKEKQAISEE
jgi:hypothetical protein